MSRYGPATTSGRQYGGGSSRGYALPPPPEPTPTTAHYYDGGPPHLQPPPPPPAEAFRDRGVHGGGVVRYAGGGDRDRRQPYRPSSSRSDEYYQRSRSPPSQSYPPKNGNVTGGRGEDWKCLECKTWNYPEDHTCARCGGAGVGITNGGGSGVERGNQHRQRRPDSHYSKYNDRGDDRRDQRYDGSRDWNGSGGGKGDDRYRNRGNYHPRGEDHARTDSFDSHRSMERNRSQEGYDNRDYRDRGNDRYRDEEEYHRNKRRSSSPNDGSDEVASGDGSVDEFGRPTSGKPPPAKKFKEPREWPPQFEENGSAFTFDSRCGMFYEVESDFFFDPKTKLYYGNKKGAYFRFNANLFPNPPFEKVDNSDGSAGASSGPMGTTTTDLEPILATAGGRPTSANSASTAASANKKSIAIKLKTKSLKSKKPKSSLESGSATAASTAAGDNIKKTHKLDLEKWSQRQQEQKKTLVTAIAATKAESEKGKEAKKSGSEDDEQKKVAKTAKGEPICMLCRRKFPTMEKLRYHEEASKLHKENLEKKKAEDVKKAKDEEVVKGETQGEAAADEAKKSIAPTYVDRAQQRRNLYGSESSTLPLVLQGAIPVGAVPPEDTADAGGTEEPHEPLGENTVGHKMLQKLGWSAGATLGRGTNEQKETHQAIARDWDRIESIAAAAQQPRQPYGRAATTSKNGGIGLL